MHEGPRRRWELWAGALATIVAVFVVARAGLLISSYDVNQNWEEPVFLFSATELQRDGLLHIFDHQDDLNHGGSVVLLLLAVPWVRVTGGSLVALKGVAILWSTLTLCAIMAIAWRYWSPRVALLLGLFHLGLSPVAARLNVTLVGSHPEALLPCALAWGAYWEWVRRQGSVSESSRYLAAAFGWACGAALWMAYMSAMFVAPVLVLRVARERRWQIATALAGGLLLGVAPWCYQDLWLRPHGALLWTQHLVAQPTGASAAPRWLETLSQLAASFGYEGAGGALLLAVCTVSWSGLILRLRGSQGLAVAPLIITPVLGLAMLANSLHPLAEVEGYYRYRFFIPLQAALFWVLAVGLARAAERFGDWVSVTAAAVTLIVGISAQAPLYGQGNHYRADFAQDRDSGCLVFGVAEWDRSPSSEAAMQRLSALSGTECRRNAFSGLGWGLGGRFLRDGDLTRAIATMERVQDPRLRWSMCGGFLFVVSRAPEGRVTAAQRAAARREVGAYCQTFRPT